LWRASRGQITSKNGRCQQENLSLPQQENLSLPQQEKFLRQIFKIYFSNFFERETITLRFFPVFLLNLCEFAVRIEIEDMKNTRGEV
jgi:hypothetical protein